jgi:hypothetical protein
MFKAIFTLSLLFSAVSAFSAEEAPNFMDSGFYDPADENVESILQMYDRYYEDVTGLSPYTNGEGVYNNLVMQIGGCRRKSCAVYLSVSLKNQRAHLYLNGRLDRSYKISSGKVGSSTYPWDGRHNGRVYDKYRSRTYPSGAGYNGLGNMPYAVFYYKGFAVHGTTSISKLGQRASHGCIRQHPDNAKRFNRLTRRYGRSQTWIRIY